MLWSTVDSDGRLLAQSNMAAAAAAAQVFYSNALSLAPILLLALAQVPARLTTHATRNDSEFAHADQLVPGRGSLWRASCGCPWPTTALPGPAAASVPEPRAGGPDEAQASRR